MSIFHSCCQLHLCVYNAHIHAYTGAYLSTYVYSLNWTLHIMLPYTRKQTNKHARTRRRTHTVSNILLALHQHHHNIIIIIIISVGSAAFVIVIVIVPYCCLSLFFLLSATYKHTNTREHISFTSVELSVCLSSRINCTRWSSRSSSLFALWRVSKYLFLFSLRVDCAIRAITLTLRSEVTALSQCQLNAAQLTCSALTGSRCARSPSQ